MLFNSLDFAIFLPTIFILYWFVLEKSIKGQNILILIASYIFYGWWDWRFLTLILFSTLVDYFVGLMLAKREDRIQRIVLLSTSILVNIGFLGFFKYYNFFLDNFIAAFSFFGYELSGNSLNIILPVGISFYTFQTLSYTIDIYREKLKATTNFIAFAAFVSFFPQLVAGPIERANNLLPQFYTKRLFRYEKAIDGSKQIVWGLFKKMIIADNCAVYADLIFNNSANYSGSTLLLGSLFFALQIYGDFSGYSDIAIGTARLFGFNLMQNFAFPYFSRDIAEFWRRWHISLSTWFRDYLYIPLGGSRVSRGKVIRNVFVIFIVSGFWHGANWTFIIWGGLNAVYFLPLLLTDNNRNHLDVVAKGRFFPNIRELYLMSTTFSLTLLAWIFFRAESLSHALGYVAGIFTASFFSVPEVLPIKLVPFLCLFFIIEWFGRENEFALQDIYSNYPRPFRWMLYYALIAIVFVFSGQEQQFIYFQF